jgi:hypothetical protein
VTTAVLPIFSDAVAIAYLPIELVRPHQDRIFAAGLFGRYARLRTK